LPEAARTVDRSSALTIPYSIRAWSALFSACVLAAVDLTMLRLHHANWSVGANAYLQACALWGVIAVLAQAPAALFDRFVLPWVSPSPERAHPARVALRALGWTALPVIAHAFLDDFTGLGGDVRELANALPWLQLALVLGVLLATIRIAGVLVVRAPAMRTLLPITLAAVLIGSALNLARDERSDRASAPNAPNLLLVVWDTARAQNTTPYGYSRDTTPHLAAACEQALRFENARSASVYTLSSHVSMLTGVHPSQHGARLMHRRFQPLATPNVVRALREAGYRTGAFVGTDVLRSQSGISHAFEHYADRVDPWVSYTHAWSLVHDLQSLGARLVPALRFNGLPHWFQDYQRPAGDVLSEALAWIENGDPRPWFCFVNLYDVHWPYLPHEESAERFAQPYTGLVDGYSERGDRVRATPGHRMGDADYARLVSLYDAELWELDRAVDAFLAKLDLQRTALVLTSDHGEAFGEGGRLEHADILECQVRVPLVVRPAGGVTAQVVQAPTSGVDIAPTLLRLAGLSAPPQMIGVDLLELRDEARHVLVEHADLVEVGRTQAALYERRFKLVRHGVGPQYRYALHDLESDPQGLVDLAAEHPQRVAELSDALVRYCSRWRPVELAIDAHGGDDVRGLHALGYLDSTQPPPRPTPAR